MKTNNANTAATEKKNWNEMNIVEKFLAIIYIFITIAAIAYWFYAALIAVYALIDGVASWIRDKFGRDEDDENDDPFDGLKVSSADKETCDAVIAALARAAAAKGEAAKGEAAKAAVEGAANACEAAAMDTD